MAKAIGNIKSELAQLTLKEQLLYCETIKDDTRKGVHKLIESVYKKKDLEEKENERLKNLSIYEINLKENGYKYIAGIDEVGRGPLAGPVVTCAVVLKELDIYRGINDSKKVNLKNRERLFDQINNSALEVSYGIATPEEIDEFNILGATKLAMKRAVEGLSIQPDHLLIDAVSLDLDIDQTNLIKGDEKSVTIAAASIMAKVTRDNMMKKYHDTYPEYDFINNKGYGTASHYVGLNKVGISPIHRKTFVKDFI